jgi:hypothetical protein
MIVTRGGADIEERWWLSLAAVPNPLEKLTKNRGSWTR